MMTGRSKSRSGSVALTPWHPSYRTNVLPHWMRDDSSPTIIEGRHLRDNNNVAVVYHNPLDNVPVGGGIRVGRRLGARDISV